MSLELCSRGSALDLRVLSAVLLVAILGAPAARAESSVPPEVPKGWLARVQEDIRKSEYRPTLQPTDAAGVAFETPRWHVVNRAQDLRAYFAPEGVRLQSRRACEGAEAWRWSYRLSAIGRGSRRRPAAAARPELRGQRIEYDRGGLV